MYTTIIRERDFTLGGCDATGEIPTFFTHTSSDPVSLVWEEKKQVTNICLLRKGKVM
jgi:hypothetical protein